MKSLSCVRLLATPWTAAYQAPLSMGFSRQEYWSGVPLPSPDLHTNFSRGRSSGLVFPSLEEFSTIYYDPHSQRLWVIYEADNLSQLHNQSSVYPILLIMLFQGEGDGTLLQHSCLENPMDGAAWWAAVHGVANSWTRLSDFTFTFHFHALEKEMATHSSVLAWRIPGMGEPGGLPSMGSHRVGHD